MNIKDAYRTSLEGCGKHERVKKDNWVGVADRSFCNRSEFCEFMSKVEGMLEDGRALKEWSRSTYVVHMTWNDREIVVKRYNYKGAIHAARQTIKNMNSRARRSWLYSHRLRTLGIPTPKPLGYIEKYKGPIVVTSYFICENLAGQRLDIYLRDKTLGPGEYSRIARKVLSLLEGMGRHRIFHGDLNFRNILLTDDKAAILDFDRVREHRLRWAYRFWRSKDLARFARDLRCYPAFEATVRGLIKEKEWSGFTSLVGGT